MNNKTYVARGDGPAQRGTELGVAAFMALLGAITVVGSLQVGIRWGAEGPGSGFFPFWLGVIIMIASAVNAWHARAIEERKLFAEWSQLKQVLLVVIPTAIYVFIIPYTGIYFASFALIALFMFWIGRYSIALTASVSIGTPIALFLMFEKWFLVPLPKGPLEDFLGL